MVMRKKRILFFDHTARMSGGERSLLLILKKIDKTKFEPFLVTPEDGPLSKEAGLIGIKTETIGIPGVVLERKRTETSIIFLLFSFIALLPTVLRLVLFIKKRGIDLIYTNSQKAHIIGLFAGLFSGIPVIWHFRDILNEGYLRKLVTFLGVRFTKAIIAISKAVAEQFVVLGRTNKRIKVIYNAIDVDDFEERQKDSKTNLRKEYKLPPNSKIIASIGQIAQWKGQEYLIYTARELVKSFSNLYFFIIGESLFKEDDYKERIQKLVMEFGLEKKVFFTGFRWDIPGVMSNIDVLLHTTVEPEPFGRVLIEAMAAGKPVIAFDNGAASEVLKDGTGLLVAPFDSKALVNAVVMLMRDKEIYKRITEKGRLCVRERFDYSVLMEKIEEILE